MYVFPKNKLYNSKKEKIRIILSPIIKLNLLILIIYLHVLISNKTSIPKTYWIIISIIATITIILLKIKPQNNHLNPEIKFNQKEIKKFGKNIEKIYLFSLMEQEYCGWINKKTYLDLLNEAKTEINETINAKTKTEITIELGDLMRDVLLSMILAWRDEKSSSPSEILKKTYEKIKKRKPFVENQQKVSEKQALKIWNNVKKQEKQLLKNTSPQSDENQNS